MKTKNKMMGGLLVALLIMASTMSGVALTSHRNCTSEVVVLTDNQMSQIAGGDLFGFVGDVLDSGCYVIYEGGRLLWDASAEIVEWIIEHGYIGPVKGPDGEWMLGIGFIIPFSCCVVDPASATSFPYGDEAHTSSSSCPSCTTTTITIDKYDEL